MSEEREITGLTEAEILQEFWDPKPKIREPLKDSPGISKLIPRYHEVMRDGISEEIVELYTIDGHEIAWLEYKGRVQYDITGQGREGEEFTGRELKCECDLTEGIGWKIYDDGHPTGISDGKLCGPFEEVLRQRIEKLKGGYVERFSADENSELVDHLEEIVFDLIYRRKKGEFLEKSNGAEFWGGYFYTQTLMKIVDAKGRQFWDKFQPLVDDKKIDLEGMVVQEYHEPPPPEWEEYATLELDGYTATAYLPAHSKMQQSWAIELTGPDGQRLEPNLGPVLSHVPDFGPDMEDVEEMQTALQDVLKAAKTSLPTRRPPLLKVTSEGD